MSQPGRKMEDQDRETEKEKTTHTESNGQEVRDGERHIYPNLESCAVTLETQRGTIQGCRKTACTHPRVLSNTRMRNAGGGGKGKGVDGRSSRMKEGKSEIHTVRELSSSDKNCNKERNAGGGGKGKGVDGRSSKMKEGKSEINTVGDKNCNKERCKVVSGAYTGQKNYARDENSDREISKMPSAQRNNTKHTDDIITTDLDVPEIHTTRRIASALVRERERQPNIPQLLRDKLDSPNTAARIRKQPSKGVNVPRSRTVFQELVSLDVSEGALETQLREALKIKASAVRPPLRPPDPEPQMSDVMDPEEYVSRAKVTTTTRFCPPASCVRPQRLTKEDVHTFSRLVMEML